MAALESVLKFRIPEARDEDIVVMKDSKGNIIARTAAELDQANKPAGDAAKPKQEGK